MGAADVRTFFNQVASDWDTMRLTYYDERVVEQLAAPPSIAPDRVAEVAPDAGCT